MSLRLALWGVVACSAALLSSGPAAAWELPVKVDAKIDFKFDVKWGYPKGPTAPWYTYFPYDPAVMGPQGNMYPNWPQPFPPTANSATRTNPASSPQGLAPQRTPTWPATMPSRPLQQTSYSVLPAYWGR